MFELNRLSTILPSNKWPKIRTKLILRVKTGKGLKSTVPVQTLGGLVFSERGRVRARLEKNKNKKINEKSQE